MSKYLIRFGTIKKTLLIPFLLALSQILLNLLENNPPEGVKNQIMDSFSNALGQMSIIFLSKLKFFSSKREKFKEEKKVASNGCLHYTILCSLILLYILLVMVNGIIGNSVSLQSIHVTGLCTTESIEIIFICLVSICLLNYHYYIHHVISIIRKFTQKIGLDYFSLFGFRPIPPPSLF